MEAFEKTVALNPTQTRALAFVIDIHLSKKDFEKALRICREQEKKAGKRLYFTSVIENLKGRIYLAKQDFEKAQAHFETSIKMDPNNLASLTALAQLYLRDNDVKRVISYLEDTLDKNPKFLGGYMILGMSYNLQGEKDKAENCYRKALAIDKDFVPAANNLAWSLAERGSNLDEALHLILIAKQKLPNDPKVLDTMGWIYYRMGYYGKAIIEFEKTVSLLPEKSLYNYHLAKAYYSNDQLDQAKGYFEKALKFNPNFSGAEDARLMLKKYHSLDG